MPGKASQRFPVHWGVEAIVDPWVLFPHQHLNIHTTKYLTRHDGEHFFEDLCLVFVSIPTMTTRVMFVGPRASRVSGPSAGRL